jgi:hypothetical protein
MARRRYCYVCGAVLPKNATRRRLYCGPACRVQAYRDRQVTERLGALGRLFLKAVALVPPDAKPKERAEHRDTYLANLGWATERAAAVGVDILIEPINGRDMPGYFLSRQAEAHAIVQEVGAPNLTRCNSTSTTARSRACPTATSPTRANST